MIFEKQETLKFTEFIESDFQWKYETVVKRVTSLFAFVYFALAVLCKKNSFLATKMASIFGRKQKPSSNKKENNPISNGNQNGVEALMTTDIMENGTKGVNGSEPDYHKNGRHSSTFKPQIPPPASSANSSSSPTSHDEKGENSHSYSTKR